MVFYQAGHRTFLRFGNGDAEIGGGPFEDVAVGHARGAHEAYRSVMEVVCGDIAGEKAHETGIHELVDVWIVGVVGKEARVSRKCPRRHGCAVHLVHY